MTLRQERQERPPRVSERQEQRQEIQHRRHRVQDRLRHLSYEPIMRGSLVDRLRKCGRPNCDQRLWDLINDLTGCELAELRRQVRERRREKSRRA